MINLINLTIKFKMNKIYKTKIYKIKFYKKKS